MVGWMRWDEWDGRVGREKKEMSKEGCNREEQLKDGMFNPSSL